MTNADQIDGFYSNLQMFFDHGHDTAVIIMTQATYDSIFEGQLVILSDNARIHIDNEAPPNYVAIVSENVFLQKYGEQAG